MKYRVYIDCWFDVEADNEAEAIEEALGMVTEGDATAIPKNEAFT